MNPTGEGQLLLREPSAQASSFRSLIRGAMVCALTLTVSGAARADEGRPAPARESPPPVMDAEPSLCREAIAARPGDELDALRRAETERWQAARHASREGKRLLKQSLGAGTSAGSRRLYDGIARAQESYMQAIREAKVICVCRERRGDPHREDCDALFRNLEGRSGARIWP